MHCSLTLVRTDGKTELRSLKVKGGRNAAQEWDSQRNDGMKYKTTILIINFYIK